MPEDIQGWGTPQIYPFWGSGQAYSVMSFPSIFGYGNANPKSTVKGKQLPCVIPATDAPGKLVRRAAEAAGTSYMVNSYSDHPELAYLFIQWLTSPSVGNRAIAPAAVRRHGLPLDQLLAPSLPGIFRRPAVRQGHEPAHQHTPRH